MDWDRRDRSNNRIDAIFDGAIIKSDSRLKRALTAVSVGRRRVRIGLRNTQHCGYRLFGRASAAGRALWAVGCEIGEDKAIRPASPRRRLYPRLPVIPTAFFPAPPHRGCRAIR